MLKGAMSSKSEVMTPLSAVILIGFSSWVGEAIGDPQKGDMAPIDPGVRRPSLLCHRVSDTEW